MNIREKLQEARILLKDEKISQSGANSFTKSKYYTLADILPPITKVCKKVGITPVVTFTSENATLTIYDFESEETLQFNSPMVELKNDNKMSLIQTLGASETYQRRFLLLNAFDIIEGDEPQGDTLGYHDIFAVKNRIEIVQTNLLKSGLSIEEIAKGVGLKDDKVLAQYINFCGQLNTLEVKLNELLVATSNGKK